MFQAKDFLYIISAKRKDYFAQLCTEQDINIMEIEVLLFLHRYPKLNTLTNIIHAKDYTKSHVSSSINKLVDDGFLQKHIAQNNKKVFKLELLPKSDALIEKILMCVDAFQKDALAGIDETEIEQMIKVLEKICDNLNEKNN